MAEPRRAARPMRKFPARRRKGHCTMPGTGRANSRGKKRPVVGAGAAGQRHTVWLPHKFRGIAATGSILCPHRPGQAVILAGCRLRGRSPWGIRSRPHPSEHRQRPHGAPIFWPKGAAARRLVVRFVASRSTAAAFSAGVYSPTERMAVLQLRAARKLVPGAERCGWR